MQKQDSADCLERGEKVKSCGQALQNALTRLGSLRHAHKEIFSFQPVTPGRHPPPPGVSASAVFKDVCDAARNRRCSVREKIKFAQRKFEANLETDTTTTRQGMVALVDCCNVHYLTAVIIVRHAVSAADSLAHPSSDGLASRNASIYFKHENRSFYHEHMTLISSQMSARFFPRLGIIESQAYCHSSRF